MTIVVIDTLRVNVYKHDVLCVGNARIKVILIASYLPLLSVNQGWETSGLILISGLRTSILSMKFHIFTLVHKTILLCKKELFGLIYA